MHKVLDRHNDHMSLVPTIVATFLHGKSADRSITLVLDRPSSSIPPSGS